MIDSAKIDRNGNYKPLSEAGKVYAEHVEKCDYNYRFGDVQGLDFARKGESQGQLLIRYFIFFTGLSQIDPSVLHVVVTHRSVVRVVSELCDFKLKNSERSPKSGEFIKELGYSSKKNKSGVQPGESIAVSLLQLREVIDYYITPELLHLKRIVVNE